MKTTSTILSAVLTLSLFYAASAQAFAREFTQDSTPVFFIRKTPVLNCVCLFTGDRAL